MADKEEELLTEQALSPTITQLLVLVATYQPKAAGSSQKPKGTHRAGWEDQLANMAFGIRFFLQPKGMMNDEHLM